MIRRYFGIIVVAGYFAGLLVLFAWLANEVRKLPGTQIAIAHGKATIKTAIKAILRYQ